MSKVSSLTIRNYRYAFKNFNMDMCDRICKKGLIYTLPIFQLKRYVTSCLTYSFEILWLAFPNILYSYLRENFSLISHSQINYASTKLLNRMRV